MEGESIDDRHAKLRVDVVAVTVLLLPTAPNGQDARRVELILKGGRLAGVTHPKDLLVTTLLLHLFESIRNVVGREFLPVLCRLAQACIRAFTERLPVLELDKFFTRVASDEDEDVA